MNYQCAVTKQKERNMTLEAALLELASAIRDQTDRVLGGQAAAAAPKAAKAAPAAEAPAKVEKQVAKAAKAAPAAADSDEVPYTKVQEAVAALANSKGKPAVKAVLAELGVANAKELTADQYADAIEKLEAAGKEEDDLA